MKNVPKDVSTKITALIKKEIGGSFDDIIKTDKSLASDPLDETKQKAAKAAKEKLAYNLSRFFGGAAEAQTSPLQLEDMPAEMQAHMEKMPTLVQDTPAFWKEISTLHEKTTEPTLKNKIAELKSSSSRSMQAVLDNDQILFGLSTQISSSEANVDSVDKIFDSYDEWAEKAFALADKFVHDIVGTDNSNLKQILGDTGYETLIKRHPDFFNFLRDSLFGTYLMTRKLSGSQADIINNYAANRYTTRQGLEVIKLRKEIKTAIQGKIFSDDKALRALFTEVSAFAEKLGQEGVPENMESVKKRDDEYQALMSRWSPIQVVILRFNVLDDKMKKMSAEAAKPLQSLKTKLTNAFSADPGNFSFEKLEIDLTPDELYWYQVCNLQVETEELFVKAHESLKVLDADMKMAAKDNMKKPLQKGDKLFATYNAIPEGIEFNTHVKTIEAALKNFFNAKAGHRTLAMKELDEARKAMEKWNEGLKKTDVLQESRRFVPEISALIKEAERLWVKEEVDNILDEIREHMKRLETAGRGSVVSHPTTTTQGKGQTFSMKTSSGDPVAKDKYVFLAQYCTKLQKTFDQFLANPSLENHKALLDLHYTHETQKGSDERVTAKQRRNKKLDFIPDAIIKSVELLVRAAAFIGTFSASKTVTNWDKQLATFFRSKSATEHKLGKMKSLIDRAEKIIQKQELQTEKKAPGMGMTPGTGGTTTT